MLHLGNYQPKAWDLQWWSIKKPQMASELNKNHLTNWQRVLNIKKIMKMFITILFIVCIKITSDITSTAHLVIAVCLNNQIQCPGQQIRSKIESLQNSNFLISPPNPKMSPLTGIVLARRFQWGSHHRVWLRNEKAIMKTVLFTLFLTVALFRPYDKAVNNQSTR